MSELRPGRTAAALGQTKRTVRVIVLLITGLVLTVGVISAMNSGDTSNSGEPPAGTSATSAGSDLTVGGIGHEARDGEFTFVVTSVKKASQLGDGYVSETAQNQFILVGMSVTNHGHEAQTLFGNDQHLYDADGKEYSGDTEAAAQLGDEGAVHDEIDPGNSLTRIVVFDVPESFTPEHLELHDSSLSNGVDVALT